MDKNYQCTCKDMKNLANHDNKHYHNCYLCVNELLTTLEAKRYYSVKRD